MQTGKALGLFPTPYTHIHIHTCTHLVPHSSGIGKSQPSLIPLCWGTKRDQSQSRHGGYEGPQLGLCPFPVSRDPPPPLLTLSVLCPQASAAGEGPSGTGIVCGAPAPSSPLNQLSPFFISHASLLFLPNCWFLFAVFSSAGSCFGLTQAVCFAEQGLPNLSLPDLPPPPTPLPLALCLGKVSPRAPGLHGPGWLEWRGRPP